MPRGVKVQLETGGKNPVVVMEDADLDRAVELTVRGAMWSAGQKCTATSRALVLPGVRGGVQGAAVTRVEALRSAIRWTRRSRSGRWSPRPAREGARLPATGKEASPAVGGGTAGPTRGTSSAPTVYLDVDPESRLGQEEVFGPVLGVIDVRDLDEALARRQRRPLRALGVGLHARHRPRRWSSSAASDAGMVHVNRETPGAEPQVPFGGMKDSSSHAREQGKAAAEFFTELKTVDIDP